MSTHRQQQVSKLLQEELNLLVSAGLTDPRLADAMVNVTNVTVSPDLRSARVFIEHALGADASRPVLAALAHAESFLREALIENINLRYVPHLSFHVDDTHVRGQRIDELLDMIEHEGHQEEMGQDMTVRQAILSLNDIAAVLERSRRILAITHIAPDGDAIGSLLGFGWLARARGKEVTLVDADPVPPELLHLPGSAAILNEPPDGHWDAVVALDASDAPRLGRVFQPGNFGGAPLIVIDHHITNLQFGQYNWVDTRAAATAQIVVHLADAWGVAITQPAAICLLTGLVTDTRGFRTSNVTPDVMSTGMRLMAAGANLAEITERTLDYQPLGTIRLWGPALDALQLEGHIIWTHVTLAMRQEKGAPAGRDGSLVSFLLSAPEAKIAVVFSEKPDGRFEVGLRSRPGFDVSAVALSLGGGGHAQAAGCTVDGPLAAAESRVLAALRDVKPSEG